MIQTVVPVFSVSFGNYFWQRVYLLSQKNESLLKMYLGAKLYGGVYPAPLRMASGVTIDISSMDWRTNNVYMNYTSWTTAESPWATGSDGTQGIIPFYFYELANTNNKYYGWADFTYNNGGGASLTLNNFAYNNTPNEGILSGGGAIPEPSSMLLLAMGGASVLVVRRRRKSQQTAESIAS